LGAGVQAQHAQVTGVGPAQALQALDGRGLPAPLRPSSPKISALATWNDTSQTAATEP
jgi:hypothetical protein